MEVKQDISARLDSKRSSMEGSAGRGIHHNMKMA
jgi:hypothetical protein